MMRRVSSLSTVWLSVMIFIMLLPLMATLLNSVATEWSDTILPSGITSGFYREVLSDTRFYAALLRSVTIAIIALSLGTLIIVPAVLTAHLYWPTLDRWMARLVILPYAVPGIVLMVGYLRIFSGPPFAIDGSPLVLVLVYIPACFPMFYIGVKNSLRSFNARDLLDAGRLLGIGDLAILWRVITPCMLPGVMVAVVLNFAVLLSEFVYAKMLVGGNFETLQMYMYAQRNLSGHISSVIVIFYFLLILIITFFAFRLLRHTESRS